MHAVLQTLVDEKIGPGERKKQFTLDFCALVGKKYGLMLRTKYDALKTALLSLGFESGDTVGMSVLSPSLYGLAVKSIGGKVLLGDINSQSGCLSEREARRMIGEGASFILLHEPVGMIPLGESWSEMGAFVIEDITESIGSALEDDRSGKRGDIVLCSFEEEDMISTAGGAAILTDRKETRDGWDSLVGGMRLFIELPDMNAALGIIQCETFTEQLEKRRLFYRLFQKSLLKTRHKVYGISNPEYDINGSGFSVQLDSRIEDVMKFASRYQVSTRRTFQGCVGSELKEDFEHFPSAIPAMIRALSFPLYPFISKSDSDMLVKVISNLP